jgi:hypothetical protein
LGHKVFKHVVDERTWVGVEVTAVANRSLHLAREVPARPFYVRVGSILGSHHIKASNSDESHEKRKGVGTHIV